MQRRKLKEETEVTRKKDQDEMEKVPAVKAEFELTLSMFEAYVRMTVKNYANKGTPLGEAITSFKYCDMPYSDILDYYQKKIRVAFNNRYHVHIKEDELLEYIATGEDPEEKFGKVAPARIS